LKKIILLQLLLFSGFVGMAQTNLDSLWRVWNDESAPESARAQAMYKISWDGYLFSQPDSAFYFAQMLYDFASLKVIGKQMARAKRIQGASFYLRSDYPKALDYYQQSLTLCEGISDKSGMASNLNNIGVIYLKKGYYPKALDYYLQCLQIKEEIQDKKGIAYALNNIGIIYKLKGDYIKAMEYYRKSLNIQEELSDLRGMVNTLYNIGLIHKNLGDYQEAMLYYRRSLKISEDVQDKSGMAGALNNIGVVYMEQGDYPNAIELFQRSIAIKEEISDSRGMGNTFTNLGLIYYRLEDYERALYWCKKGLNTSLEINAIEEQKDACGCLYDIYKSVGNAIIALEYHEKITILDDSLQIVETTKKLQQMEFARQILADSLQQEKEKLKIQIANEREVQKKIRDRNIFLLSALFVLILAIGFHQRMIRVRRARKAIENEKDRSEKLLLNILPSQIAGELKDKGKADARKFEQVSILFTDFKDFIRISEKLNAKELVEEINSCFKPFDAICEKYGIEKIKTIGDTYMAAGGLPVLLNDSVKKTVLAGLEMQEFIINRKKEREEEGNVYFEMHVGIHTGQVIAGIVGVSKFQYDIWGDTVNTAARIESSGEIGKVNISQSTYQMIKNDPAFKFRSRGKVKVKGKEDIEMWFVEKA